MPHTIRVDPPIPITTAEGDARIYFMTDYGRDEYVSWTGFLLDTGEVRHWNDPDIRLWEVATDHRFSTSPFNAKAGPKRPGPSSKRRG